MSEILLRFDVESFHWKFYPNELVLDLLDVLAEVCGHSGIYCCVTVLEAREATAGEHTCH